MKLLFSAIAVAAGLCAVADTPVATSADCAYALDTEGGWPRSIKTSADVAALPLAVYRAGDSLVTTAPDGTTTTIAKAANAAEALPINAGGLWTFANPRQKGEASFMVRHSACGTQGEGTDQSPAEIVDADEISDLVNAGTATSGYVFTCYGSGSLLPSLVRPAGFCLEERPNGTFRLVTSVNGVVYTWAEVSYPLDSRKDGPNRLVLPNESFKVAYSGDDWRRDMSKAATLTFVPPEGEPTFLDFTGTGVTPESFTFDQRGTWIVRLTMADSTVREAVVRVKRGFVISFW